jgi:ribosomal protein S25
MGANKKKSSAASEKATSSGVTETKKDKKEDGAKVEDRGRQKQKLAVFVEESQGRKTLQNMKAITPQGFARASGVKVSVEKSICWFTKNNCDSLGSFDHQNISWLDRLHKLQMRVDRPYWIHRC